MADAGGHCGAAPVKRNSFGFTSRIKSACCRHINLFAAQYKVELFWIGLAFNAAGLAYIGSRVFLARRAYRESEACLKALLPLLLGQTKAAGNTGGFFA